MLRVWKGRTVVGFVKNVVKHTFSGNCNCSGGGCCCGVVVMVFCGFVQLWGRVLGRIKFCGGL